MPFLSSSYLGHKIEFIYIICIYVLYSNISEAVEYFFQCIVFQVCCIKVLNVQYYGRTYLLSVVDSAQLESALSGTALSLNQRCLGQCSA